MMKLYYEAGEYVADGSTAIMTYSVTEYGLEPYGHVTVCLVEYGITPMNGYVVMPTYKMSDDFVKQIMNDIVEEPVAEIPIGYGSGLLVRLKKNWFDQVDMVEGR